MNASLNDIGFSDVDDHQIGDNDIQNRKTIVKLGAGLQAFRKDSLQENAVVETTAVRLDGANVHDPRQTRELDADDFFSLGKFTI